MSINYEKCFFCRILCVPRLLLRLFNIRSLTLFYIPILNYIRQDTDDKCSFCKSEPETLHHLLFNCVYSRLFWKDFEFYFYSLSKEFVHLSLQDVLIGITTSECPLLNYFLLIAKLYLWDCRRSQILPNLVGFKINIKIKFETEKYICTKNKTLDKFRKNGGHFVQSKL